MPHTAQNGRTPATATNLKSKFLGQTSKGTADQFTDCINPNIKLTNTGLQVSQSQKITLNLKVEL